MDIKKMQQAFAEQDRQQELATSRQNSANQTISTQEFDLRNQKPGENVVVRFVQDGDPDNAWFWVARSTHTLMFRGVKDDPANANSAVYVTLPGYNKTVDKNGQLVSSRDGGSRNMAMLPVPADCVYTNKEDPIQAYSSQNDLFNHPEIKDPSGERSLGEAIKRRVVYLFQGFVNEVPKHTENGQDVPFEGRNTPPRLLRHFTFGSDIFDRIIVETRDFVKEGIDPTDLASGYNFIIEASKQGQYTTRGASRFERRPSQITPDQALDIKNNGYDRLSDRLMKKPDAAQIQLIKEIFTAYLAGQPFDKEWGKTFNYRIVNQNRNNNTQTAAPVETTVEPVETVSAVESATQVVESAPVAQPAQQAQTMSADDLLAMLAGGATQQ